MLDPRFTHFGRVSRALEFIGEVVGNAPARQGFPMSVSETGNFDILRNAPVYFREMGTLPSDGGKIGGF